MTFEGKKDDAREPREAEQPKARRPRGFAVMDRKLVSQIASKGGKAAHKAGTAHEFTSEEAREAHVNGQIPAALQEVGSDLLAEAADIKPIDVLAIK